MNYRPVLALVAALAAGALAAVVTPRFTEEGEVSWLVTIAVAVLVGAVVALVTHQRVDDEA